MAYPNTQLGFSRLEVLLLTTIVVVIGAWIVFWGGRQEWNRSSVPEPAAAGAGRLSTDPDSLSAHDGLEDDTGERDSGTHDDGVSSEFTEPSLALALPSSGQSTNSAESLPDDGALSPSGNPQKPHDAPAASSDIEAELQRIAGLPWGPDAEKQLQKVLAQWAQRDPAAALAYAMSLESRRAGSAAVNTLLAQWAQSDPAAALDWFTQALASQPQLLAGAASSLFAKIAKADPNLALRYVWQLPQKNIINQALDAIVNQMMANDQKDQLLQYFNAMNDSAAQSTLAKVMVNQWATYYPEMTAQWISGLADPAVRRYAAMALIATWGYDNPARAAQWVAGLPKDQDWGPEVNRMIEIWAKDYPDKASAWLATLSPPSASLDPAVRQLVRTVMHNNPEGAMAWAHALSATGERHQLMQQVGAAWMKQDPSRASAYIISSDLPIQIKKRLLRIR